MKTNRSKIIVKSGYLFIVANLLLAALNIIIGLLSNSLAIVSDAIHSLTDSISGFLIVITEKIASKEKYSEYRNKIERATTIIIALIIILVGIHIIIESIEKIIHPDEVSFTVTTIIILITSVLVKYGLAHYLKTTGKSIKSNVLIASGAETMNDAWISIAVLASTLVYIIWHINIESYISIIISLVIIKIGFEFIFPHISNHHHHPFESNPDHDHCGKTLKEEKNDKRGKK